MPNCNWVRCGSLAAVIAVPALAVAFLGGNLFSGSVVPGTVSVTDTRDFYFSGQQLSTPAPAAAPQQAEEFLGNWQNTVRTPPSPRI
jgi:hypothetical protein